MQKSECKPCEMFGNPGVCILHFASLCILNFRLRTFSATWWEEAMRACAKFAAACILGALVPQGAVLAAELVILTNQGATPGVRELAAAFERASGTRGLASRKRARRSSEESTAAQQTSSPEIPA